MSENRKSLEVVENEIKETLKRKMKLKKKELKRQLNEEEEVELEGMVELLAVLEKDKKYWQGEVSKENSNTPDVESKHFGKADLEYTASVTGIDYQYREWTTYV